MSAAVTSKSTLEAIIKSPVPSPEIRVVLNCDVDQGVVGSVIDAPPITRNS